MLSSSRLAVWLSVFLAGAVLMALEILAFRVVGKTFGSALHETSMVIAVFLASMSLGYYAGGKAGDRRPRVSTLAITLLLASLLIMLVPLLDVVVSRAVYASVLPLPTHAAVVSIALFFLPTLFLATVSPIAVRLFAHDPLRSGSVAGSVSAVSTVGSIAGSLLAAFVLIDFFESVNRTIYFLAFLAAALAVTCIFAAVRATSSETSVSRRFYLVPTALAVILVFGWIQWQAHAPAVVPSGPEYGNVLRYRRDSPYHQIVVRDFNRYRHLYFGLQLQSRMSLEDPFSGGTAYSRYFHFATVLKPDLENVVFIGLGGGTGPKEFVHDYPGVVTESVDVDPAVIDVAQRFFMVEPGPRLQLIRADGRTFMKRTTKQYDAVIIDAYTTNRYGSTIPAHLTTREFFAEVGEKLKHDGMVIYNCGARTDTVMFLALSKTLRLQFSKQMVFNVGGNTLVIASNQYEPNAEALRQGVVEALRKGQVRRAELERLSGSLISVPSSKYLGVPVLTDDFAPVDTLMRNARRR